MEEFPRQSDGSNYCIKMLLSDSGNDPGQFSSPGIERMKELYLEPFSASKTREKTHTKDRIKLTHKRNTSALAEDSHHLGNI